MLDGGETPPSLAAETDALHITANQADALLAPGVSQ
jgi:hypothetical protein